MLDTHARKWVQPGIETTARSFLKAGFGQEEIWISMGYNEARAESLVKKGIYPEGTKPFLLEDAGSIGNTHFLSVPFNSPNQAG